MLSWIKRLFLSPAPQPSCCASSPSPKPPVLPTDRKIAKVWIEPGCLVCNACEVTCPAVFKTLDDHAVIIDGAEAAFSANRDAIETAALGCCVDVIRVQYEDGSLLPIS